MPHGLAKLLRAAHNDPRLLVRVPVEVLLRTGPPLGALAVPRALGRPHVLEVQPTPNGLTEHCPP